MSLATLYSTFYQRTAAMTACMLGLGIAGVAHGQMVESTTARHISIVADYHEGNPAQPALILLHGFLQTGRSQPMASLAANLASKGYTTLSPTMSLGINHRTQSMPCESVHTHIMDDELAEIAHWADWLYKKGHRNIVMLGFSSTGNIGVMLYAASKPQHIGKFILVSLNPLFTDPADAAKFRSAQKSSAMPMPVMSSLGYCKKNFAATAKTYFSYSQYNERKLLGMIAQSPAPLTIILGNNDAILPANWISKISALKSSSEIRQIAEANHFFDGTAEFDLAEEIEKLLKSPPAK